MSLSRLDIDRLWILWSSIIRISWCLSSFLPSRNCFIPLMGSAVYTHLCTAALDSFSASVIPKLGDRGLTRINKGHDPEQKKSNTIKWTRRAAKQGIDGGAKAPPRPLRAPKPPPRIWRLHLMQQNVAELGFVSNRQMVSRNSRVHRQHWIWWPRSTKAESREAADITVPGHVILGDVRAR